MNITVDKNKHEIQSIIILIGILMVELIRFVLINKSVFMFIIYIESSNSIIDIIVIMIEYFVILDIIIPQIIVLCKLDIIR